MIYEGVAAGRWALQGGKGTKFCKGDLSGWQVPDKADVLTSWAFLCKL